jgi:putative ABC transport system permease protein
VTTDARESLHDAPQTSSFFGALSAGYVYFRIAVRALRGHMFRSFLTTVSILIGAFSIVLMSSLAASGLATLSRGLEDLGGARLILLWGKEAERERGKAASYTRGLTMQDRDALFAAIPHVVGHSMYATLGQQNASNDGAHFVRTDYVAADGDFIAAYHMQIEKGRALTDEDSKREAKVCVIGHKLAEELFDGDAVGKWLVRDGNMRCQVVGQLVDHSYFGMSLGFDASDIAIWPLGTIVGYQGASTVFPEFVLRTDVASSNESVKRIVNAILVDRHNGVDDFQLFDFSGIMEKVHDQLAIMQAIVGFIAGIALLVGGVGVMNMMLVSVSERVREIGVRKALGASPGAIRAQFLWEAVLLAGLGGGIGVMLGIGAAIGLGPMLQHFEKSWVNVIATGAATTALIVSMSIGLVFGYFPAMRASKLDAIAAMRR